MEGARPVFAERYAPYLAFGFLAAAWELLSRRIVDPLILPAPSLILTTTILGLFGVADVSYPIARHTAHSLVLLTAGCLLGIVTGIVGGVAVGLSGRLERLLSPLVGFLLPIPAIAWAPVAMVWFGSGARAILVMVTYACFVDLFYTTSGGIRAVPTQYVWQIKTFGARRGFILWHVMLPSAFPHIFAGIKLGLAASWRTLVGAEMFAGASFGLGFMLYEAREFYATDVMFSALLIVAVISLALERVGLRAIERRTLERWGLARALQG